MVLSTPRSHSTLALQHRPVEFIVETVTRKMCSIQTDKGKTLRLVEICIPADACAIGMRGVLGPHLYEWVVTPGDETDWDRELQPFQMAKELRTTNSFAATVREALSREQPQCQSDWWWSYHVRKNAPGFGHNVVTIVFGPSEIMRVVIAAGNVPTGWQFIPGQA